MTNDHAFKLVAVGENFAAIMLAQELSKRLATELKPESEAALVALLDDEDETLHKSSLPCAYLLWKSRRSEAIKKFTRITSGGTALLI